jgi:hypothetical protein
MGMGRTRRGLRVSRTKAPRHRGIDRFVRRPGPSGAAPVRDETCLCIEPMRLGVRGGPLTRVGGGRGAFFCSTHCCCTSCTNEVSAAATQAGRGETVAREVGRTAREAERSWVATLHRSPPSESAVSYSPSARRPRLSSCSSPRAPSLPSNDRGPILPFPCVEVLEGGGLTRAHLRTVLGQLLRERFEQADRAFATGFAAVVTIEEDRVFGEAKQRALAGGNEFHRAK